MRPLFGITEAAVQCNAGFQACWDRMARSVFCLSPISCHSLSQLSVHLCDLFYLTLVLFVRLSGEALHKPVVGCKNGGKGHDTIMFFKIKNRKSHFQGFIRLIVYTGNGNQRDCLMIPWQWVKLN